MAADTTKVVFALDYATADGKTHKGGSAVAVDSHEARALILKGVAQYAKGETPAPAAATNETIVGTADQTKGGK